MILIISSIESSYININSPESINEAEFLLTFPRSGTNLFIVTTQLLFQKPVKKLTNLKRHNDPQLNRLHLTLDYTKTPLYRTHDVIPEMHNLNPFTNKLIVVLRNYKECLISENNYTPEQLKLDILDDNQNVKYSFSKYIKILNFFESWKDKSSKLLIYYEDLVKQDRETLNTIVQFFDESSDLEKMYKNYKANLQKSLSSYSKQTGRGLSKGLDVYHSLDIPQEILHEIDEFIEITYPNLWSKYLSRYKS